MSKFIRNLSLFIAGLPLLTQKTDAAAALQAASQNPTEPTAVPLRPLNFEHDNLFAGHRSHSSHSSHRSHYSGYSSSAPASAPVVPAAPVAPAVPSQRSLSPDAQPAASTSRPNALMDSSADSPTAPAPTRTLPGNAATSNQAHPAPKSQPIPASLSLDEKRRLQVMRVQIALTGLGLYNGPVDGFMNDATRTGLRLFQDLKGIPKSGTMTTPTLNALGVPAVN